RGPVVNDTDHGVWIVGQVGLERDQDGADDERLVGVDVGVPPRVVCKHFEVGGAHLVGERFHPLPVTRYSAFWVGRRIDDKQSSSNSSSSPAARTRFCEFPRPTCLYQAHEKSLHWKFGGHTSG